jgi:hypothetical protein
LLVQSGYRDAAKVLISGKKGRIERYYVDAPAERRDALADDGVLVYGEDLVVREDAKNVGCDGGELPEG